MVSWMEMLRERLETDNPRQEHYIPKRKALPHPQDIWEHLLHYLEKGIGPYFDLDGRVVNERSFEAVHRTPVDTKLY